MSLLLDLIEIDDSPPSAVSYWVPELKLKDNEKKLLVEESPLTDRHMNGTCNLIREQFPDIPVPQTTLRVARPELIKEAEEEFFFFHYFCEHWALSHIRDNVVYLYDSLQPKSITLNSCRTTAFITVEPVYNGHLGTRYIWPLYTGGCYRENLHKVVSSILVAKIVINE